MDFAGFLSGSNTDIAPSLDAQISRNVFFEPGSQYSKNKAALLGRAGLGTFRDLGLPGPVMSLLGAENRMFAVATGGILGGESIEIFADATYAGLGPIVANGTPAYQAVNGSQLATVAAGLFNIDDGSGPVVPNFAELSGTVDTADVPDVGTVTWKSGDTFDLRMIGQPIRIDGTIYTVASIISAEKLLLTGSAGTLTDVVYEDVILRVTAGSLCFLDGYFIVNAPGTQQFNISALDDGQTWDPLDFAKKEGYPDAILRVFADHENLWLFGDQQSTEVWQNTGAANFPFQRIPGNFIHYGLAAKDSVVRLNNGVAWIALDVERGGPMAVYAQGFVPNRISTFAEEALWTSLGNISDAVAMSVIDRGHHFWVITFPSANRTRVYDATTNQWTEWSTQGAANNRFRPICNAYAALAPHGASPFVGVKQYMGDFSNGKIYIMDPTFVNDAGVSFQKLRRAPHLCQEQHRVFYGYFQLDAAIFDPAITLEVSEDSAQTFKMIGVPSFTPAAGPAQGSRTTWLRTGSSRDRIYQVSSVADVVTSWTGAYIGLKGERPPR